MELNRSECEFLTGDLAAAEQRLSTLASRAANLCGSGRCRVPASGFKITLGRADRAVEICVEYLHEAGIAWPTYPTDEDVREEYFRLCLQLSGRTDRSRFSTCRSCSILDWRATMEVLTELSAPGLLS